MPNRLLRDPIKHFDLREYNLIQQQRGWKVFDSDHRSTQCNQWWSYVLCIVSKSAYAYVLRMWKKGRILLGWTAYHARTTALSSNLSISQCWVRLSYLELGTLVPPDTSCIELDSVQDAKYCTGSGWWNYGDVHIGPKRQEISFSWTRM